MSFEEDIFSLIKDHFDIDTVYGFEDIKSLLRDNYDLEDIFTIKELQEWAANNGYVKAAEDEEA